MKTAFTLVVGAALLVLVALGAREAHRMCGPNWWLYGKNLGAAVVLGYCEGTP